LVFVCILVLGAWSLPAAPPLESVSVPSPRPPALIGGPSQAQLTNCLVSLIEDIQVPAREAGSLTAVEVVEGQFVTAGQLLAQIDDRQPKLDKLAA
jgi:multidrug efflux pump subunit AcrA (membrane-fusion protein)